MRLEGIIDVAATTMRGAAAGVDRAAVDAHAIASLAEGAGSTAAAAGNAASDAVAGADALGSRLAELLDRPPADLTIDEWDEVAAALAADPVGRTFIGPRTLFEAPDLPQVVDAIRLGDREQLPVIERYLAANAALQRGHGSMRDVAREQMRRLPSELSRDDWRALSAVVDADPTGAIVGVPAMAQREYAGLRQTIVDQAHRGSHLDDTQAFVQFNHWARDHDPDYTARLTDAVDAAISKRWTGRQYWTLRSQADRFEQLATLLADRTPAERRQVAWVVADRNTYTLAAWMQRHDPEYGRLLQEAVDRAASGADTQLGGLDRPLLSTIRTDGFEPFFAGRSLEQQRTLATQLWSGARRNEWHRAHDPEWPRVVDDAVDQLLAGNADFRVKQLLRDEGDHLLAAMSDRPFEDAARAHRELLRIEAYAPWLREHAPDWSRRVDDAIERIATSEPADQYDRRIVELHAADHDPLTLLGDRPFEQQNRIARAAMPQFDYFDWRHANDPVERAQAMELIPRVLDDLDLDKEQRILLRGQRPNIDELVAGRPWEDQERIARAVLGAGSTYFANWMRVNDPGIDHRIVDAARAVAADSHTSEQFAVLSTLGERLPDHVADLSLADRLRVYRTVGRASFARESWYDATRAEAMEAARQHARAAEHAELDADARVVLSTVHERLDELVAGRDYETQLRIADGALDGHRLHEWKVANDPDRVARIRASATALADGTGTEHDARVLRGEADVLGVLAGRPYEDRLRVAQRVFGDHDINYWKRANDPAYHARLDEAIDAIVAGNASDEQLEAIRMDRTNAFRRLALREPRDHDAVAAAILGLAENDREGVFGAMRRLALDSRQRLDALPELSAELQPIRDQASELVDRNIRRMSGYELDDPNLGYANHPDYAELGRAEASIKLLEAVGARQVDSANVGDLLSW